MRTDKDQELWLLSMGGKRPNETSGPDTGAASMHNTVSGKAQKYAKWAAIAAVGVTTATVVSGS